MAGKGKGAGGRGRGGTRGGRGRGGTRPYKPAYRPPAGRHTDSPSATIINRLHGRGWTDTQIGRAINRDSSLIHQIRTGRKPGHNLAGALGNLDARFVSPPGGRQGVRLDVTPTARTSAAGTPARVRQAAEQIPGGSMLSVRRGAASLRREVHDAAQHDRRRLQITITASRAILYHRRDARGRPVYTKNAEIRLFDKGGMDADRFYNRLMHPRTSHIPGENDGWAAGDILAMLRELAGKMEHVEYVGRIRSVEMLTFDMGPAEPRRGPHTRAIQARRRQVQIMRRGERMRGGE